MSTLITKLVAATIPACISLSTKDQPAGSMGPPSPARATALSPRDVFSPPPELPPSRGDDIYNTLYITDQQQYINGSGDSWAGRGALGELYDLQMVDDVFLEGDCALSSVVRDFVSFFGAVPANGAYVALYDTTSESLPEEQAYVEADGVRTEITYFSDTLFGMVGVRLTATPASPMLAPSGRWFIETQPHDETESGDYYYAVRDGNCIQMEPFFRDGGRAKGAYGTETWVSIYVYGYGCASLAMAVRGECGPRRLVCVYEVTSIELRSSVCGDRCDRCPLRARQLVCANECPGGEGGCARRMRAFSVCGNGSGCLVRLKWVACDVPPFHCRSCP